MKNNDWRVKHGKVLRDFIKFLNDRTDKYVLKGGTSLMLCYNLNRFSEDIDLDSTDKRSIKAIVDDFCKLHKYPYRIAKDTDTVKRFMINYDDTADKKKPLKVEISYRKIKIENKDVTNINGISVYNISNIALMKSTAYSARDKIRDLFDVVFICNNYFDELDDYAKKSLQEALSYKGIEQYDLIINDQSDELIDPDILAENFLTAWDKLDLNTSDDATADQHKNESNGPTDLFNEPGGLGF